MEKDTANQVRGLLRREMAVTDQYAYFDHAAVAPLPNCSAQAISQYALEANQHGDAVWLNWAKQLKELRASAARFIGANPSEIALVNNTTHGINLIAEGLDWRTGDNVVIPSNEFPSNLLPWHNLKRYGVEVREMVPPPSGGVSVDELLKLVDGRTRLIAVSWVGFLSGYRLDVEQLVERAHAKGVAVFLDAIQGLGVFPIDVGTMQVDFLCADGHKWMLGPEGAGMLYIREAQLPRLKPIGIGWNSLEIGGFDPSSRKIKGSAARYEGGSYNMAGLIGFNASLGLLEELGAGKPSSPVAAAVLSNVEHLQRQLLERDFTVHVSDDSANRSGIVGITWADGNDTAYRDARAHLLERHVVTSVRGGRLRVSTHAYNNEDDMQRLIDGLMEFRSR